MYGNMKKTERPFHYLMQNPGWHALTDIAFACGLTVRETGNGLRGKPVEKKNQWSKFPVACSGNFCYKCTDILYRVVA